MPFADILIEARERLLDLLSGSDRSQALNAPSRGGHIASIDDPAAELHRLLLEAISASAAADGQSVDYAALRASPLYADVQRCTGRLAAFDPSSLPNRNAQLSFWINLYNTLVLDAVIVLGVRRSVMERRAGVGFFRQAAYIVDGERMSCDDIEHGVLRLNRGHPFFPGPQFGPSDARRKWVIEPFEPRVHFALNCASNSCPPIRAYAATDLRAQLDLATQSFLSGEVRLDAGQNALHLSEIFKWYAGDFGGRAGTIDFVLARLPDWEAADRMAKARRRISLRYTKYDWRLNGRA
jgi:hypothetical protein